MKYILKYLGRTKDIFLIFDNRELRVQDYTDSDFMSDVHDSKSTSSSIFLCNDDIVSWKSCK